MAASVGSSGAGSSAPELRPQVVRLDDFRRFLGQWRILVMRHRASPALGDLLRPIDEEIAAGHGGIDLLRTLGQECRAGTVPIEPAALDAQVSRIRAASAAA